MDVLENLRSIADGCDSEYHEFNRRVVCTGYDMLGVRMPALRGFAKKFAATPEAGEWLAAGLAGSAGPVCDTRRAGNLREPVYEEVMLYGLVLALRARKMPLEEVFRLFDALIPHFDSWSHVDVIVSSFKVFARHEDEVFAHFRPLKTHSGEFEKRTFVVLLMDFFMDPGHIDRTLEELAGVPQGQYYVDMAIAWALSVALVKHYEATMPLLTNPVFTRFVHNKAIQKARESFRISPEQKSYLDTLKIR